MNFNKIKLENVIYFGSTGIWLKKNLTFQFRLKNEVSEILLFVLPFCQQTLFVPIVFQGKALLRFKTLWLKLMVHKLWNRTLIVLAPGVLHILDAKCFFLLNAFKLQFRT